MNLRIKNKPAPIRASMLLALVAAALGAGSDGAGAVTIYRCGASGNSFSDRPCTNGQAFEAADARSAAQRTEAARVAAIERQLADDMQRERLRLVAAAPRMAAGFNGGPVRTSESTVTSESRNRSARRTAVRPLPFVTGRAEFIAYAPAVKVSRR